MKRRPLSWAHVVTLAALLGLAGKTMAATGGQENWNIVTSIRPLGLIAHDVLGETANIQVLVPPTLSPHDYTLKASDVKALYKADVVVWLGPELEQFLVKPMSNLPSKQILTLNEGAAIKDSHDHHDADSHGWLDPLRAKAMAVKLLNKVTELARKDDSYRRDQQEVITAHYDALLSRLDQQFAAVRNTGFVVYHPGYEALIERFSLAQIGWVTISPEQPPGLKHLLDLEKAVKQARETQPVKCLFIEGGHENPAAQEIGNRLGLRVVALDILGADNSLTTYAAMMEKLTTDMVSCLNA